MGRMVLVALAAMVVLLVVSVLLIQLFSGSVTLASWLTTPLSDTRPGVPVAGAPPAAATR
jgi:hypothetical protein